MRLELDAQRWDRYGRMLAYMWFPDGIMLNEEVLPEGQAVLLSIPSTCVT